MTCDVRCATCDVRPAMCDVRSTKHEVRKDEARRTKAERLTSDLVLRTSYFLTSEELGVLLLLQIVDHLDVQVGQLLHLLEPLLLVVLREAVVLEHLLEPVVGV